MNILFPPTKIGPPVLVAHPWWGLNRTIRDYGAALAKEGFVVGMPDVFEGHVVTAIDDAQKQIETYWEAAAERLTAGLTELSKAAEGKPVGAVGFSFGGFHLLRLLGESVPLRRLVVYYATYPLRGPHVPVMAHLAADDSFESADDMAALRESLTEAGPPNAVYTYTGTKHWFAEADRPEYAASAATTAFRRTVAFLRG